MAGRVPASAVDATQLTIRQPRADRQAPAAQVATDGLAELGGSQLMRTADESDGAGRCGFLYALLVGDRRSQDLQAVVVPMRCTSTTTARSSCG